MHAPDCHSRFEVRACAPQRRRPVADAGRWAASLRHLIVAVAFLLPPVALPADSSSGSRVEIEIANVAIPLGVATHFSDVANRLPKPGYRPVGFKPAFRHAGAALCFKYMLNPKEAVLVELYDDGQFGMHSARIARVDAATARECSEVSSMPKLTIGSTSIVLLRTMPQVSGLATDERYTYPAIKEAGYKVLGREWQEGQNPRTQHQLSVHFKLMPNGAALEAIEVMNWAEPT